MRKRTPYPNTHKKKRPRQTEKEIVAMHDFGLGLVIRKKIMIMRGIYTMIRILIICYIYVCMLW